LRTILHADMDAFYATIEQRDDPRLRGKPVVVGGSLPRSVVATASYEARKFGVHSAMPGVIAKRKCPQAIFVMPRMEVYARVAAQVREVFSRFTPLVEPLSLDEAFLDVTDSRALFGDGEAIARRLKDAVRAATQLTVSVGVAATKYVAKVASDLRKPDGLVVVPPGTEREFLAPLPVTRLWGVGKVSEQRFAELGLVTIGDVQKLSGADCVRLFGEAFGRHVHALSQALDPRPVEVDHEAKSISRETTFTKDVVRREEAHRVLLAFAQDVARELRAEGLRARLVRIKVRDPDFRTITRQARLVEPTRLDVDLYRAAVKLFDRHWRDGAPIRLLGLGSAQLVPEDQPAQRSLFGGSRDESDRLMTAVEKIRARFGDGAIRRGEGGGV
jgi:DNA polymerase-4